MKKQHYLFAAAFMICLHVLMLNHLLSRNKQNVSKTGLANRNIEEVKKSSTIKTEKKPTVFFASDLSINK